MSISMEDFRHTATLSALHLTRRQPVLTPMFQLECRSCRYEVPNDVVAPRHCPKCGSRSWERYARPGSILTNAQAH